MVVRLIEANIVKNVELDFRSPVTRVGKSGRLQVLLGFLSDISRVPRVRLARERIADVANQAQCRNLRERIEHRRIRIRKQQHVAFVN